MTGALRTQTEIHARTGDDVISHVAPPVMKSSIDRYQIDRRNMGTGCIALHMRVAHLNNRRCLQARHILRHLYILGNSLLSCRRSSPGDNQFSSARKKNLRRKSWGAKQLCLFLV